MVHIPVVWFGLAIMAGTYVGCCVGAGVTWYVLRLTKWGRDGDAE